MWFLIGCGCCLGFFNICLFFCFFVEKKLIYEVVHFFNVITRSTHFILSLSGYLSDTISNSIIRTLLVKSSSNIKMCNF